MTPALQARGLRVRLPGGIAALHDLELSLGAGELVGIVGPNGAGKSTLLRALAGLVPLEAGEVLVHGSRLAELPRRARARTLAYLPQDTPAELPFTAAEVVLMGRAPHLGALGLEGEADRAQAAAALDAVDARALADRPLPTLSGGERRRVLLAAVLAQQARLWLLDEPTAHLDVQHQELVLELARSHCARGGAAVLVLHELLAASRCDRVVLLGAGRVAADGPPAEALAPARLQALFGVPFVTLSHPAGRTVAVPAGDATERRR